MSGFPLYDNLIKEVRKKDLTVKEKKAFVQGVAKLDDHGRELIYALICVYDKVNNETSADGLPYKGVDIEKSAGNHDLTWSLAAFPIPLRQLLHIFMRMHLKKLQEEMISFVGGDGEIPRRL